MIINQSSFASFTSMKFQNLYSVSLSQFSFILLTFFCLVSAARALQSRRAFYLRMRILPRSSSIYEHRHQTFSHKIRRKHRSIESRTMFVHVSTSSSIMHRLAIITSIRDNQTLLRIYLVALLLKHHRLSLVDMRIRVRIESRDFTTNWKESESNERHWMIFANSYFRSCQSQRRVENVARWRVQIDWVCRWEWASLLLRSNRLEFRSSCFEAWFRVMTLIRSRVKT